MFQEKKPPYEVCIVELGYQWLELAAYKFEFARNLWGACLSQGTEQKHWPGYPRAVHQLEVPAYYYERWNERISNTETFRTDKPSKEALAAARHMQAPENYTLAGE